jgi:MYXO-CTERM domain-containing protein
MRTRTILTATALTVAFSATAGAVVPQGKKADRGLVSHATVAKSRSFAAPVRSVPATAQAAFDRVTAAGLGRVLWDPDTATPTQFWGAGIAVPGANADAAIAEAAARAFLADHLALMAPGATLADFELVSNTERPGFRAVGFVQRLGGKRVIGAQIGFVFRHDRIVLVNSTALPEVRTAALARTAARAELETGARGWIAAATGKAAKVTTVEGQAILPIVRPRTLAGTRIEYHVVNTVGVALQDGVGAWDVYVDAATGKPLARRDLLRYAQGTVTYTVPIRNPQGDRDAYPAVRANHTVNGSSATSNASGVVMWAGAGAGTVNPGLVGPRVRVNNDAGAEATASLTLPAGGTVNWDRGDLGTADAQLSAFIHANLVKDYVKTRIAPTMSWLDQQINVNVNVNGTCNALSGGDDLYFFPADDTCENTARIADVVYHEMGHSIHGEAIIPGVGGWNPAVSEGVSDFLAATMTNDSGMGRGFFFTNAPLRELDPPGTELVYPDDVTGEEHADGEIIAQALWDMRKALIATLGAEAGVAKAEAIWFHILEASVDLPSSYAAALEADDDDGNVENGTPNLCTIQQAFGLHGLAETVISQLGISRPVLDGLAVSVDVEAPDSGGECPTGSVVDGTLQWVVRDGSQVATIELTGTNNGPDSMTWAASIPAQANGTVVQYKLTLNLSTGDSVVFPDNRADPWYELYVGPVEEIWCDDFESGNDGWEFGNAGNEWAVGAPEGLSEDPDAAYEGNNVLGIDLTGDGKYDSETAQFARTPVVDVTGKTGVRLQYRRWLGVEDGFWDHATILADGVERWANFNSMQGNASNVAHKDGEWRFHDVELDEDAADGSVQLEFRLESDQALEFGGWTMDRVCIVAQGAGSADVCGDGTVTGGEACDDGNTADGDGCSATCTDEDGAGPDESGGCCQTGSSGSGPLALGLLTLGLVLRRRRRAA